MKNSLYLLLIPFFIACGKKEEVAPDAAARVAGTYEISRFAVTGTGSTDFDVALPRSGSLNGVSVTQSGQLALTRVTESTVTMTVTIKITGQTDRPDDFGTFEVRGNDLYQSNLKVGTADGSSVNIDAPESGGRVIITARK